MRVIVSACLMGRRCRYDDGSKPSATVQAWVRDHEVLAVCPEEHLGVPRPAANLVGGDGHDVLDGAARVMTADADVTQAFIAGAERCARDADQAILKARSPSCGCAENGGFDGVFAALLRRRGVPVRTDEDL